MIFVECINLIMPGGETIDHSKLKPPTDAQTDPNVIILKISSQNNEDIVFRVKKTTTFEKLIDKYCERFNITNKEQVRLLNDGIKIQKNKTPQELNLENGDILECVIEQEGGCVSCDN